MNKNLFNHLKSRSRVDGHGCWIWTGSINTNGYGNARYKGKTTSVPRIIYALANPGDNIAGKCICHHCDVRACINPKHLYAGTKLDNAKDTVRRNRISRLFGRSNASAKLSEKKILKARALNASGISTRALGRQFKVSQSTISNAIAGRTWPHVK